MSFGEVAAAAIRLARDGFPMYPLMAASLQRHEPDHRAWPSSAEIFLPNGRVPEAGDIFRQTDLAASLQYMADEEQAAVAKHSGRPRGRLAGGARRLLPRRHRQKDRRLYEGPGRAAVGRGSGQLPLAGRPARTPPLWRSRSLHLRRLVPGAGPAADPGLARRRRPQGPRPQQRRLCPPFGRGAKARLCRPRGLLRRPGDDRGAARDPDLGGIRRRAPQNDPPRPGLAGNAAAGRARQPSRPRLWRLSSPPPRRPQPRARHLLCLRRRPPRQSVLGDPERRFLRLAGGAGDRADPVEPRLAIAPRPAPSGRVSPPANGRG